MNWSLSPFHLPYLLDKWRGENLSIVWVKHLEIERYSKRILFQRRLKWIEASLIHFHSYPIHKNQVFKTKYEASSALKRWYFRFRQWFYWNDLLSLIMNNISALRIFIACDIWFSNLFVFIYECIQRWIGCKRVWLKSMQCWSIAWLKNMENGFGVMRVDSFKNKKLFAEKLSIELVQ